MPRQKDDADTMRLSAIEEDILTVLLGQELYGLEILDHLNPGRPIELSVGSLYPTLNRLEKKGFISWHWGDENDVSGGARRKYYKMTELGASILYDVQKYRISLVQQVMKKSYFPEEVMAELAELKERLISEKKSTWMIKSILLYQILSLVWGIYIQINIDNLTLPSRDRRIDK